jgi:F0F1-type ATP synthase assembly protein I
MNMTDSSDKLTRKIRRAAVVGGLGLVVQLAAAFHWTPVTFILSAVVGAPLVMLGGVLFLAAVWRNMRDKGAV